MTDRQPMVAGNWKLNGTRASATALAADVARGARRRHRPRRDGALPDLSATSVSSPRRCPAPVSRSGAQDCAEHESGAFHTARSRRRCSPRAVAPTSSSVTRSGARCSGRPAEHDRRQGAGGAGGGADADPLRRRDARGARGRSRRGGRRRAARRAPRGARRRPPSETSSCAYEPVWAIGTGKTASPEEAQAVHRLIREPRGPRRDRGRGLTRSSSSTAAASSPTTRRRCSGSRTSTAVSSAVPRSTPTPSSPSAAPPARLPLHPGRSGAARPEASRRGAPDTHRGARPSNPIAAPPGGAVTEHRVSRCNRSR